MSVGEVNSGIGQAKTILAETQGPYEEYEKLVTDAYGGHPNAPEKVDELKNYIPGIGFVHGGIHSSLTHAADKAREVLGKSLDGTQNTEVTAAIDAGFAQIDEATIAKGRILEEMFTMREEIWGILGALATKVKEYNSLTGQYAENVKKAAEGRDSVINTLNEVHF